MQFKIYYTKLGNQFFFISNLSEWHFSCRKKYNEAWIKKTGPLSRKEKQALKNFKAIIKEYGFGIKGGKRIYMGIPFVVSSSLQVWKKVERWVGKSKQKELKKIFRIFEPRFEKIWPASVNQLKEAKQIFEKELKGEGPDKALNNLASLYKNKAEAKKILEIYLFNSPLKDGFGGGANLNRREITLELSNVKREDISHILSVIFHEIAHIFERRHFRPSLKKWIKRLSESEKKEIRKTKLYQEVKNLEIILDEMIVSSFLPEGYLMPHPNLRTAK